MRPKLSGLQVPGNHPSKFCSYRFDGRRELAGGGRDRFMMLFYVHPCRYAKLIMTHYDVWKREHLRFAAYIGDDVRVCDVVDMLIGCFNYVILPRVSQLWVRTQLRD